MLHSSEAIWDKIRERIWERIRERIWERIRERIRERIWERLWERLRETLRETLSENLRENLLGNPKNGPQGSGQNDLAVVQFCLSFLMMIMLCISLRILPIAKPPKPPKTSTSWVLPRVLSSMVNYFIPLKKTRLKLRNVYKAELKGFFTFQAGKWPFP